jgi:hypothetical protein
VFNLDPVPGKDYKVLSDREAFQALCRLYRECLSDSTAIDSVMGRFWKNTQWRKSTFLKIRIKNGSAVLEIFRDRDYSGDYELRHTQILW